MLGKADVRIVGLVPEAIAFPRLPELNGDDAGEGGPDQATLKRSLAHPAREEIDVVHGGIYALHTGYHLRRHFSGQILERGGLLQIAERSVLIVRRHPVIAGPVNVQGYQIHAGVRNAVLLEQVVGHLAGDELIQRLHRRSHQAAYHLVDHMLLVEHVRIEESVAQQDRRIDVLIAAIHARQVRSQQRMADSEGCGGELVEHTGIAGGRIFLIVTLGQ